MDLVKTACLYFFIAILFFSLLGVIIHKATDNKDQGENQWQKTEEQSPGKGCGANSFMINDGVCDEVTNIERCLYDGGDCCLQDKATHLCNVCTCKIDFDEKELLSDFDKHRVKVFVDSVDFSAVTVNLIKTVHDVVDVNVCSMICLDKKHTSLSNAWILLKDKEQCQCTLVETLICYDTDNSDIRIKPFLGELGYLNKDSVAFIQLDKTVPCGCFTEDFAFKAEPLSHFDPDFIEPTNEISPWHCQKACQDRPPCQAFSFNIDASVTCNFETKNTTVPTPESGWLYGPVYCKTVVSSETFVTTTSTATSSSTTTATDSTNQKFQMNKILLVSGAEWIDEEIVDLTDENSYCPFLKSNNLGDKQQGMGGLLLREHPIYCGGFGATGGNDVAGTRDCYRFYMDSKKWEIFTTMTTARTEASYVIFNDNTELFLIGGRNKDGAVLDSTEFVSIDGTREGPDLPMSLFGSCAVKITNTEAITMTGWTTDNVDVPDTFIYSSVTNEWTPGPDLLVARYIYHACGSLMDSISSDMYVVTLGGITSHIHFQNIYEYWIANRGSDNVGFIRGVNDDLPEDFLNGETPGQMVYGIEMVTSQTGKEIYLLGGHLWSNVYKLKISFGKFIWTKTDRRINMRHYAVAYLVPDDIADCF